MITARSDPQDFTCVAFDRCLRWGVCGGIAGLTLASAMALVGCKPKKVEPKQTTESLIEVAATSDALQAELADRTRKLLGQTQDFKVLVTVAAYPVGTLMREGSTIPVDYTDCVPSSPPPTVQAPSMFPSFSLSRTAAIGFGLDEAVLEGLGNAGANVSNQNDISLKFADTSFSMLSDHDIKAITSSQACTAALKDGPVWLVRGYVLGRRIFHLGATQANKVNLGVTHIGSFDVNPGSGGNAIDVSDSGDVGYLQIVSELSPVVAPPPTAGVPAPVVVAVTPPTAAAAATAGRVYVQRDQGDASGNDKKIVAALGATSLSVFPQVQAIDTAKMPRVAQVRYFNDGDLAKANTALAQLQKTYPDAKLVHISLPSPAGQLEVWLPKAATVAPSASASQPSAAAKQSLLVPAARLKAMAGP